MARPSAPGKLGFDRSVSARASKAPRSCSSAHSMATTLSMFFCIISCSSRFLPAASRGQPLGLLLWYVVVERLAGCLAVSLLVVVGVLLEPVSALAETGGREGLELRSVYVAY